MSRSNATDVSRRRSERRVRIDDGARLLQPPHGEKISGAKTSAPSGGVMAGGAGVPASWSLQRATTNPCRPASGHRPGSNHHEHPETAGGVSAIHGSNCGGHTRRAGVACDSRQLLNPQKVRRLAGPAPEWALPLHPHCGQLAQSGGNLVWHPIAKGVARRQF